MADIAGVAPLFAGDVVAETSGTAAADTVPGGALVLWRNTGAGAHVVTLTTNNLSQGLAVADQSINLAAGQVRVSRVAPEWADANGRVQVAIDGTASEVKYYVLGA
jgi:hypothetical protein